MIAPGLSFAPSNHQDLVSMGKEQKQGVLDAHTLRFAPQEMT